MEEKNQQYKDLFLELEQYEKYGIPLIMDGELSSPMQIMTAHLIKEEGCYMRDYVVDSTGHIKELSFQQLKQKDEE